MQWWETHFCRGCLFLYYVKSDQAVIDAFRKKDEYDNGEESAFIILVRSNKNSEKILNSQAMECPGKGQDGSVSWV